MYDPECRALESIFDTFDTLGGRQSALLPIRSRHMSVYILGQAELWHVREDHLSGSCTLKMIWIREDSYTSPSCVVVYTYSLPIRTQLLIRDLRVDCLLMNSEPLVSLVG